jgi:hypothetical protein
MSKRLYPDIAPGQEMGIDWMEKDFLFACCDCHLVHRLRFRVEGDKVIMQVWREDGRTGALRRHRGIPIKET